MPCPTCNTINVIGIFYLKDKEHICFQCLDKLRYGLHIKLEDIHELTSKEVSDKLTDLNSIKKESSEN